MKSYYSKVKEFLNRDLNDDSLLSFLEALSLSLESGTDLDSAIKSISKDIKDKYLKEKLIEVSKQINSGNRLWVALKESNILPKRSIEILRIGEENAMLPQNLKMIVDQKRYEKEISTQLKSAMIYPGIILSIGLLVAFGTLWFILPKITPIYEGMDIELPITTQMLIALGNNISSVNILIPIFLIISLITLFIFLLKRPSFRMKIERILLKLPGIGTIIMEVEVSRMGIIIGSLLTVGISIDKSIQSLAQSTPFTIYRELYLNLLFQIQSGSTFNKSFVNYPQSDKLLPSTVKQMIDSAEKSGNLPKVFMNLGEGYNARLKNSAKSFTQILEPALLIIIWLFVSFIAISIILPIYSLIGSF